MDGVLHDREVGLKELPRNLKRILQRNEADDFVAKIRKQMDVEVQGSSHPEPLPPLTLPPLPLPPSREVTVAM